MRMFIKISGTVAVIAVLCLIGGRVSGAQASIPTSSLSWRRLCEHPQHRPQDRPIPKHGPLPVRRGNALHFS